MTTTLEPNAPVPEPAPPGGPSLPRWALVAFLAGGAVFLAIAIGALALRGSSQGERAASEWHGRLLDPAASRPEFVLTDTDGQPFDFAEQTRGQLTLVYFGYTNCPDVCPVQLATLAQALDKVQVSTRVVFITTDPARDTPERLASWLAAFPHDITGLTGNLADIEAAQRAVGATVAIADPADGSGDYTVGHTSAVYVITPDDRVRLAYPFGTRQEDWVQDLPRIAAEKAWQAPTAEGTP